MFLYTQEIQVQKVDPNWYIHSDFFRETRISSGVTVVLQIHNNYIVLSEHPAY